MCPTKNRTEFYITLFLDIKLRSYEIELTKK